jgi:uncharacterized protein
VQSGPPLNNPSYPSSHEKCFDSFSLFYQVTSIKAVCHGPHKMSIFFARPPTIANHFSLSLRTRMCLSPTRPTHLFPCITMTASKPSHVPAPAHDSEPTPAPSQGQSATLSPAAATRIAFSYVPETFVPFGTTNPHIQTIVSAFYPPSPRPTMNFVHGSLLTDDGLDRIHYDIVNGSTLRPPDNGESAPPVVLIIHGLEAGSKTSLTCRLANAITPLGFKAVLFNFRSCSEEAPIPLSCKTYHAGMYEDVLTLVRECRGQPIYLLGYSLGANVLFNLIGNLSIVQTAELGIIAAGALSVPFDPAGCQAKLDAGFSKAFYAKRFVASLASKVKAMDGAGIPLHDDINMKKLMAATTVGEFDDEYVAKTYGFGDRFGYYRAIDPRQFLSRVSVPTYIITARDDPFFDHNGQSTTSLPTGAEIGDAPIKFNITNHGGHCGFADKDGLLRTRPGYPAREFARFFAHVRTMLAVEQPVELGVRTRDDSPIGFLLPGPPARPSTKRSAQGGAEVFKGDTLETEYAVKRRAM